MSETTTLGPYLKRERERRGLTLRAISETTKVSVSLLEGLEADDVSRWPGGIFRRAFVRSYAQCVGLDADDVLRRFEQQHPVVSDSLGLGDTAAALAESAPPLQPVPPQRQPATFGLPSQRARLTGTAADLAVAAVLAFGSAAAGSRLLWPVLMIAAYYATGIVLTGTSPMVALLAEPDASVNEGAASGQVPRPPASGGSEQRRQRRHERHRHRHRRGAHARAQ